MTAKRFFVYGSLTEGMVHYSKIQNFIESLSFARIKATAYRLKVGYPALVKGGSDLVPGQLVELKASELLVGLLDEFYGFNQLDPEKSLYSREEVDVFVEGSSEPIKAWTYFLNPLKLPVNASVIEGGDWRKSMEDQPLMTSKLTEKQSTYIQRLGRSTGREIVPIDLTLYRELMNLELIVDKGRRLALSKLGQEVFKHLG
ncbi:gamma-glutamylcyclotransferase family protein [Bdellovibrio sp. HCB209]|uniref:gamma-glutamylcyclotransferase family protein n=1 Tax=Bdellovibrio sp. HCB209 TaxID=3394354 RepID=UPI0039B46C77